VDARTVEIILLILTLVLAAMSAAAETALTALSAPDLHQLAEHSPVGKIIAFLRSEPNRFLTTILIVSSTSLIVASSMATLLFASMGKPWGELVATFGISLLVLIFAELTPKNIAVRQPEGVSKFLARPVYFFSIALRPIIVVANGLVGGLMALVGQGGGGTVVPRVTEDDVRSTISLAGQSEGLTVEETERIESILDLDKVLVDQAMRPRVAIAAVPADMPLEQALDVVQRDGHSRITVYADGIDAMSREEAGYWLGMALHRRRPRRVLAALRMLLTEA